MSVIERTEQRLAEEERQHELGADNRYDLHYWAAYLDGARAQKKEGGELAMSALNYVERQGFMTGMDYAGMTEEEREALLKELRNLRVGPVAPLVAGNDYAKLVAALRKLDMSEPCPCEDSVLCRESDCIVCQAADAIEALMPKRGEWVEDTTTYAGPGLSNYKCSLCGKICGTWRSGLKPSELPNWCGNCGADMRKMEETDADRLD